MPHDLNINEQYKIVELTGEGSLSGVTIRKMADNDTLFLPAEGVFIAIGLKPNPGLVTHLVDLNERGEIIIGDAFCPHRTRQPEPGFFGALRHLRGNADRQSNGQRRHGVIP